MITAIIESGGLILLLIMLASLLGGAVAVERLWRLLPLRRAFDEAWQECETALQRGGPEKAAAALRQAEDGMQRVLQRGLQMRRHGRGLVREAAFEAAQREVPSLERGLVVLSIVAHVSPLLGLLGTVAGLIEAFQAASAAADVTTAALADGIYLALGTTAAGLAVGIPASIAYQALAGLAGRLIGRLEYAAGELPVLLEAQA